MDILLINPPYWIGEKKTLGWRRRIDIPLGLCYIASMLENHGDNTKILDMDAANINIENVKESISHFEPDVVGITSLTCNFINAIHIAKAAKSYRSDATVILGGVHATFNHKQILDKIKEIDVIVHYEGEYIICDIIDALRLEKPLHGIKGTSYRIGNCIITNPKRKRIDNLDNMPIPAFHLLVPSVEEYFINNKDRELPVLTTRGCPHRCIYCSTSALHGHKYRTRSVSNVMKELIHLKYKYNINRIKFLDDNFTAKEDRVFDLCHDIKIKCLDLNWSCSARADELSEELLKTMASAGCDEIFFGVESVSQEVLGRIGRKEFIVEKAKDMIKFAERLGIKTNCSFIIGLPGETLESLNKIVEFVEEVNPSGRVLPNLLDIYPGTDLFDHKNEYFSETNPISQNDITRFRLKLFFGSYEAKTKTKQLMRIAPPNIRVRKNSLH